MTRCGGGSLKKKVTIRRNLSRIKRVWFIGISFELDIVPVVLEGALELEKRSFSPLVVVKVLVAEWHRRLKPLRQCLSKDWRKIGTCAQPTSGALYSFHLDFFFASDCFYIFANSETWYFSVQFWSLQFKEWYKHILLAWSRRDGANWKQRKRKRKKFKWLVCMICGARELH